jgi:hypothetical protein
MGAQIGGIATKVGQKMRRNSVQKAPSTKSMDLVMKVEADSEFRFTLKWGTGRHTLSWERQANTEAGSCDLRSYPMLLPSTVDSVKGIVPTSEELQLLEALTIHVCTHKTITRDQIRDNFGAHPVHCLLLSNTEEAMQAFEVIVTKVPGLMTLAYSAGPFEGQTCMHMLAVNRREAQIVRLLDLAPTHLTPEQRRHLISQHAGGRFFKEKPMVLYGGSAFAFMVRFGLKKAIYMLWRDMRWAAERRILLDDEVAYCSASGFLPLHVAVAAGNAGMYHFLTEGLRNIPPLHRGANPEALTRSGTSLSEPSDLTPLALAALLGKVDMCEHIIRSRCHVQWTWGPVRSFQLPLEQIDTSGDHQRHDLIEIVAMLGARPATQTLVLDTFLGGFVYQLIVEKWVRFARAAHYVLLALNMLFLALIIALGFSLKTQPQSTDRIVTPLLALVCIAMLIGLDVLSFIRWWSKHRGRASSSSEQSLQLVEPSMRLPVVQQQQADRSSQASATRRSWNTPIVQLLMKANLFFSLLGTSSRFALVSRTSAAAACIILFRDEMALRQGVVPVYAADVEEVLAERSWGRGDEAVWPLLAVASFVQFILTMNLALVPFSNLGVFAITVERLVKTDLMIFITFLLIYLCNFYITLFVAYPRAGNGTLPHAEAFNDWQSALTATFDLGLGVVDIALVDLGSRFSLSDVRESPQQIFGFAIFLLTYVLAIILLIVLLLRLFMAMLTTTFLRVQERSILEWRLQFTRAVLRAEALWPTCLGSTAAGVLGSDGQRFVERREVMPDELYYAHSKDEPLGVSEHPSGQSASPATRPLPVSRLGQRSAHNSCAGLPVATAAGAVSSPPPGKLAHQATTLGPIVALHDPPGGVASDGSHSPSPAANADAEEPAADFEQFDQSLSASQERQSMVFSDESMLADAEETGVSFNPFDWRTPFSA